MTAAKKRLGRCPAEPIAAASDEDERHSILQPSMSRETAVRRERGSHADRSKVSA
jgi:hypothetical protein